MCRSVTQFCVLTALLATAIARPLSAQTAPADQHQHAQQPDDASPWMFMSDAVVNAMFDHQGGPRGANEVRAPNWWMGMATRTAGGGRLTVTRCSASTADIGRAVSRDVSGRRDARGRPIINRQYPHDILMQLAAVWRRPVTSGFVLTLAGGPAGEPALGPIAFMHRPSAEKLVLAPLGHHTWTPRRRVWRRHRRDRTRRAGWRPRCSTAASPTRRWDFDFGRSTRSPAASVPPVERIRISGVHGPLMHPEALEPGEVQRTTASVSWLGRVTDGDFSAMTAGFGVNAAHGVVRHAVFGEYTRQLASTALSAGAELVETEAWTGHVGSLTGGVMREVFNGLRLEALVGVNVTVYAVPEAVRPAYGRPVSFQLFLRIRPRPGHMGRMWNMRMAKPFCAPVPSLPRRSSVCRERAKAGAGG